MNFNLVYWHRTIPGKKLLAKRVTITDYVCIDPVTGERTQTSKAKLIKDYRPDEQNELSGRGITRACRGKRKGVRTDSKAFQDYLMGAV